MIKRLRLVRFKRFEEEVFDLAGQSVILAGPNNSGKTTLLQAVSTWSLALSRWRLEGGPSGGRTKRISVVLDEFTALPLREMNLLWLNRHVARKAKDAKTPKAAPIYIEATVDGAAGGEQSLTIEILYANEKLVYVRPVRSPEQPLALPTLPPLAEALQVVHVPPFSGIGTQEPRHSPGIQSKLIGEGRAGEIVRNLVLEIWEASGQRADATPWSALDANLERLFQYKLLPPQFSDAQPYILCEYRPQTLGGRGQRGPKLDVANAGSGFHQVLLLLAFFYARPSSVLLLDEPDAHLHFILQREIFDLLKSVAQERNCKLIVATHAEVLLAGAEPDQIVSFVGAHPKRLVNQHQKSTLTDALRTLSSLDLLQASHVGAVLYVEDESDYKILREWAAILGHAASSFLSFPYVWPLQGKGSLGEAKRHFACLRLAEPPLKGLCVLDRDRGPAAEDADSPAGLEIVRWPRYEIENYLLNPSVLKRFLDRQVDLFGAGELEADRARVDEAFAANFPASIDWLSNPPVLTDLKGSDFLVDVLSRTSRPLPKRDLYMLAAKSLDREIHADVRAMLQRIAAIRPDVVPVLAVNSSPDDANGVSEPADPEREPNAP
jgi:predicted ATPase